MNHLTTRAALLTFIEIHKPLLSHPTFMDEANELIDAHETAVAEMCIEQRPCIVNSSHLDTNAVAEGSPSPVELQPTAAEEAIAEPTSSSEPTQTAPAPEATSEPTSEPADEIYSAHVPAIDYRLEDI